MECSKEDMQNLNYEILELNKKLVDENLSLDELFALKEQGDKLLEKQRKIIMGMKS